MKTVIQCIILLACAAMCNAVVIKSCRCFGTSKSVRVSLIANIIEYAPRPYCNKHEVIVRLKDTTMHCLDPNEEFTQSLLQAKKEKAARAMRKKSRPNTIAVQATELATDSATDSAAVVPATTTPESP